MLGRNGFSQRALFDSPRQFNHATQSREHVIGRSWADDNYDQASVPMQYSTRNDPRPVAAPEIGAVSSPKKRLPDGPAPQKKQKNGYGEGAGFPRNSQNGYQQGHLFAHEAPARAASTRDHVGHAPVRGEQAAPDDPYQDDSRRVMKPYDTRMAKGSLTGHYNPETPLYHGTKIALQGDEIVPGKFKAIDQVGHRKGLARDGRRLNAYATPDADLAAGYSKNVRGKPGKAAKVFEVKPTGPVSADLEYLHGAGDPLAIQDSIKRGELPAVKSPRPFKVISEAQFGNPGSREGT